MSNKHFFQSVAALGAVAVAVGIFALRSRLATEHPPIAQPPAVTAPESASVSDAEDRSASDREEIAQLRAHNAKLVANVQAVAAALQQAFDRKVEALMPILTSEQLKTYRDLEEKQIQMIQAFFPKGAAPVLPTPTTIQSP